MLPGFFLYEISRKLLGEFVTASCIQKTSGVADYRGSPSRKKKSNKRKTLQTNITPHLPQSFLFFGI